MLTKKELEDYRRNKSYLEKLKNHILTLYEQTQKITSTISDMPRGSGNEVQDRMAENLAKMIDNQNEFLENIIKRQERLLIIIKELDKIDKVKYKNILFDYYIDGLNLEEIEIDGVFSYGHKKRLLKEALKYVKNVP